MAGGGRMPSQSRSCMQSPIMSRFSMNVSRRVMRREASSESCTIFITGLFDCGDTMLRETSISSDSSARAS